MSPKAGDRGGHLHLSGAFSRVGELTAFRHDEPWQPMDTLREKHLLDRLWKSGDAPVWK